jgi:hypothetical protein
VYWSKDPRREIVSVKDKDCFEIYIILFYDLGNESTLMDFGLGDIVYRKYPKRVL